MERESKALKNEICELRGEVRQLEAHTRRDNLRFFNIPDKVMENTEDTLCRFIYEKLKLDPRDIDFSIVHRLGPYKPGQSRCILARFVRRKDIQRIKAACVNLRGTKFGVSDDLPSEWAAARKQAYPRYVKPAKEEKKKIRGRGTDYSLMMKRLTLQLQTKTKYKS